MLSKRKGKVKRKGKGKGKNDGGQPKGKGKVTLVSYDGDRSKGKNSSKCYNCGKSGQYARDYRRLRAHRIQGLWPLSGSGLRHMQGPCAASAMLASLAQFTPTPTNAVRLLVPPRLHR